MCSQLPNFNALFIVSLIAAVTSISYSTIGWVAAVADGREAAVSYEILGEPTPKLMSIFNALGTCVFAYGGHSVVLEIQVWTICVGPLVGCCRTRVSHSRSMQRKLLQADLGLSNDMDIVQESGTVQARI